MFDESMSAFRPRTSRFGNLPHLSCIDRKPEPLGTELKVTNTTKIGLGLYLEIQRGRDGMADSEFVSEMKKTAACCCRMVKGTVSSSHDDQRDGQVDTYLGDSSCWAADGAIGPSRGTIRISSRCCGTLRRKSSK